MSTLRQPVFSSHVAAGFPSPADDHIDAELNLHEHLIPSPSSTFFVRVAGDSMIRAGVFPGDLLIVDRSLTARNGDVVLASLNGEFTVKRLRKKENASPSGQKRQDKENLIFLCPENPAYKAIKVTQDMDFEIWGVVSSSIRYHR